MLKCREVSERASDFLDGSVTFRVRLQMRLHLMMCRFCREYVRQMALVVRTVRRLPQDEPAAAVKAKLLSAFRSERQ
jgi:predicted anti-sigma-YlaC factor YlaD